MPDGLVTCWIPHESALHWEVLTTYFISEMSWHHLMRQTGSPHFMDDNWGSQVLQAARRRVCRIVMGPQWTRKDMPIQRGKGFPRWQSGKESACQGRGYRGYKRCEVKPWIGKIPWTRKWQPTPVILPEKSHRQRSLAGYSPWGHKELDMTEQLSTA